MARSKIQKKCPGCGKLMDGRGFMNHIRAKHPDRLHLFTKPGVRLQAALVTDLLDNLVEAVKSETIQAATDSEILQARNDIMVQHPPHYTFGKFEVINVLQDWFPTNPLLWQVCKYIARADHKVNPIQDLEKAKFYLEREIERRKPAN